MKQQKGFSKQEVDEMMAHLDTFEGELGYALFVCEMLEGHLEMEPMRDIEDAHTIIGICQSDNKELKKTLKHLIKRYEAHQRLERLSRSHAKNA